MYLSSLKPVEASGGVEQGRGATLGCLCQLRGSWRLCGGYRGIVEEGNYRIKQLMIDR